MKGPKYKRVLLKISGEALLSKGGHGIVLDALKLIARELKPVYNLETQLSIVIGGGNIWRARMAVTGAKGGKKEEFVIDRVTSDYMGMLATIMNALAIQDALEKEGIPTRVMTAIDMHKLAEPYIRRKAVRHLEKRRVVIFAGGTGNPYFTTDTAAALRAVEINADIILKATKVDGVYDDDPMKNRKAKKYEELPYLEAINKNLKIMDTTAISLCMDNKISIIVFNLWKTGNIKRAVLGEKVGTVIS